MFSELLPPLVVAILQWYRPPRRRGSRELASRADSGATRGLLPPASAPGGPRSDAHPQTDGAHRTFASSSKHSRKAKSTLARRPARAPTARRVRGASSLVHRVVVPSLSCFARMALEDQRRRQPFRMAQGGPQVGPQGQSKTITVTITGACRARRAARAPAPEAGCHDSAHPAPPAREINNPKSARVSTRLGSRVRPPRASVSASDENRHHPLLRAGEHEHVIGGYSLLKGIGDGEPIASDRFTVGGHEWVLLFYPGGKRSTNDPNNPPPNDDPYAALFVALIGEGPRPQGVVQSISGRVVRAFHRFTLVDQSGNNGDIGKGRQRDQGAVKIGCARQDPNARNCHGYRKFVRRSVLEAPNNGYLVDDTIVIARAMARSLTSGARAQPPEQTEPRVRRRGRLPDPRRPGAFHVDGRRD